jgi:hypothetical protein
MIAFVGALFALGEVAGAGAAPVVMLVTGDVVITVLMLVVVIVVLADVPPDIVEFCAFTLYFHKRVCSLNLNIFGRYPLADVPRIRICLILDVHYCLYVLHITSEIAIIPKMKENIY